jgi:hypothetical protein
VYEDLTLKQDWLLGIKFNKILISAGTFATDTSSVTSFRTLKLILLQTSKLREPKTE